MLVSLSRAVLAVAVLAAAGPGRAVAQGCSCGCGCGAAQPDAAASQGAAEQGGAAPVAHGPAADGPVAAQAQGGAEEGPDAAEARVREARARFAPSPVCAECHTNAPAAGAMRDPRRREISPVQLWSGTAMAGSFRDPIWRAAVVAEVAAAPAREREIVAVCVSCHAPMGSRTLAGREVGLEVLRPGGGDALWDDGVSCTVCHRISAEGLGEDATFVGAFRLVEDRVIVGPHAEPFRMPMLHHTGFEPVQGEQVLRSALCATCHTVLTEAAGDGAPGPAFVEQAPYLEWRNSAFSAEGTERGATCQACHLPVRSVDGDAIETRIARNPMGRDFPPIDPRQPYGRHVLVGGNVLLPALLGAGTPASDGAGTAAGDGARPGYEAVAALAREQLARRSARVDLARVVAKGRTLSFVARVANLTGHKLPTGHPSRRAWLRVRVRDAAGRLVFASGEHDRAGRILGPAGAPLASELPGAAPEPHRTAIRRPDEVQVYELVMEDRRGEPTEALLQAVRPRKDDRLLPAGWSPRHRDAARTRPVGTDADPDFAAGADAVSYEVALPAAAPRPLQLEVALLYQSLSPRHAAALVRPDADASRALAAALEASGNAPATVAIARRTLK